SRASRTAAGSWSRNRSRGKTRLPRDLDIFSPWYRTMPVWSQRRANGARLAGSDWARSDSWGGVGGAAPPAMEVDGAPEVAPGHGRALQVPAGSAPPPRALPPRLPRLAALPDDEVQRVALARVAGVAAPLGQQLALGAGVEPGQLPEPRVGGDVEEQGAVDLVGVPAVDQATGQLEHGRDLLRGPWGEVPPGAPERGRV